MENAGEGEWIEIKSYPFLRGWYLQAVITTCTYPAYGTDGELQSIIYDLANDRWMDLSVLSDAGYDEDYVLPKVYEAFTPTFEGEVITDAKIAGYLMVKPVSDGAEEPEILLELTTKGEQSEPWTYFYSYTPLTNELKKLDPSCLFDPFLMDNPGDIPLSYEGR
jgi:hypothetical protein